MTNLPNLTEDIKILFTKHFKEFEDKVSTEKDISTILLKGHLFIEYYLDHLLILLFDKEIHLRSFGFYQKIKKLKEKSVFSDEMFNCLFGLNDLRNNLAHSLNFKVSTSEIDTIGFYLGKNYIIKKFSKEFEDEKKLLIYVIEEISNTIFIEIFFNIMREKKIKIAEENDVAAKNLEQPIKIGSEKK